MVVSGISRRAKYLLSLIYLTMTMIALIVQLINLKWPSPSVARNASCQGSAETESDGSVLQIVSVFLSLSPPLSLRFPQGQLAPETPEPRDSKNNRHPCKIHGRRDDLGGASVCFPLT